MRSGSAKWSLSHRIAVAMRWAGAPAEAIWRSLGPCSPVSTRYVSSRSTSGERAAMSRALEQAHESEDRVEQGRLDRAQRYPARGSGAARVGGGTVSHELP